MKLSTRVTLLCAFAAAGLGVAIGTALTVDPSTGPSPTAAPGQVAESEGPCNPTSAAPFEPEARPTQKPGSSQVADSPIHEPEGRPTLKSESPQVANPPVRGPDASARDRSGSGDRARPFEPPAVDRPVEGLFRSVSIAGGAKDRPAEKTVDSLAEHSPAGTAACPVPEQRSPSSDPIATRAYRPQNVTPAELQRLVEPLLTDRVGTATVSPSLDVGGQPASRAAAGGGVGTVVVVRDHPAVLDQIDRVVAEVDVRPPQLRVQTLVLTVHLKETYPQGIDFDFLRERKHLRSRVASPADAAPGLPEALMAGPSGLKCGLLEGSLASLLDTLDTVVPTRLTAVPAMTVGEGSPLEIPLAATAGGAVGEGDLQPDSSDGSRGSLLLRPLASVEGSIRLELEVPRSDDDLGAGAGKDSPATILIVPDAATVLLGGIVRRSPRIAGEKAPMFDRLPTLRRGGLASGDKAWGQETLVLLNPHVVSETDQGREQTAEAIPREVRQSIARRYFLAARQALAGKDRRQALDLLEAALRFDSLDPQAIEARNKLWLSRTTGADGPANQRLAAGRLP